MGPAIAIRKRQYVRAINKHVLAIMGGGTQNDPPLNSTPVASSSYSTKGWQSIVVFHRQRIILIFILITKLACHDPGGVRGTIINGLKSIYQICLLQTGLYGEQACSKRGPFHRFSVDSYLLTKFWKNPPQLSQSLK